MVERYGFPTTKMIMKNFCDNMKNESTKIDIDDFYEYVEKMESQLLNEAEESNLPLIRHNALNASVNYWIAKQIMREYVSKFGDTL